ncbi:hypothetical protein HNR56_004214 [Roseospira marina]|nr:hypothetical protein [Roseospira marina]MBB5089485.1 hypothetical protein [Roseospira marina]
MLRFLVFFRYGMAFHGPRIGDHVESETRAFERRLADMVPTAAVTAKPAI